MPARLVVIGGDAAGMSAAAQARRVDPSLEILVLERGPFVSYSMCGEPYYIGDVVPSFDDLLVHTPEYFRDARGLDVRLRQEAIGIDTGAHTVEVLDQTTGERRSERYDRLIIATGARASVPRLPGVDAPNIFTLRSLEDTVAIKEAALRDDVMRVVVVGSGYIGLEMVEAFTRNGLEVSLVEMAETVLCAVSAACSVAPAFGERIAAVLRNHGVCVYTGEAVRAFTSGTAGGVCEVTTDRRTLPADLVLMATGVRPNSARAAAAGRALGVAHPTRVDPRRAASAPDVFAAGDCAEHLHRVSGRPTYVPLGTTANRQGHVAGENAAGGSARFAGILGTAATKVFEAEVARTGLSAAAARDAGFDPVPASAQALSRSGYYPGSVPIHIELLADRQTGRLLGAQAIGEEGAAARIDVFATALAAEMTVEAIEALDLAYAPPLAPLWDPVLRAARAAEKALA